MGIFDMNRCIKNAWIYNHNVNPVSFLFRYFQKILWFYILYLFELRHPVPRPKFAKDQYIISAEDNSDNNSAH